MNAKMGARILPASLALLVAGVLLTLGRAACYEADEAGSSRQKLPKLFDFEFYKERFGKTYESLLENLDRKRLFFARAFKAFVSGTQYKLRLQSHYNALNDMSDWSQPERDAMINKRMLEAGPRTQEGGQEEAAAAAAAAAANGSQKAQEFIPDEREQYEEELGELIRAHDHEPGFRELAEELHADKRRMKRALSARQFSFEKLIASDENAEPASEKLRLEVPSNNPHYEPIELASLGFKNTQNVRWHTLERKDPRPFIEQASEFVDSIFKREWGFNAERRRESEEQEQEEEEAANSEAREQMVVDLRQNGCFVPIKSQHRCGSCWAFSTVSVLEWIYCNQTGALTPFSQQYLIDCGPSSSWGIAGCEGAIMPSSAVWFVNNFGMELAKHYPYRAKQGACPYEANTDVQKTGYIRTPIKHVAEVHMSRWEGVLAYGPMLINFATGAGFHDYGGGVFEGRDCGLQTDHSMVLMGHGKQDGQEFWLIRNSHGRYWGEAGYMKLSKRYAKRCLATYGQALGTKDGVNYEIDFALATGERPANKKWQARNLTWIERHIG